MDERHRGGSTATHPPIDNLVNRALTKAKVPAAHRREPIRVWALSGVERVHSPQGTVIVKYARAPFCDEPRVLAHVADQGIPTPKLLAAVGNETTMAMVLEDLGDPLRHPTTEEAAAAAVATHLTTPPDDLLVLDRPTLAALPGRCLATLGRLVAAGRWTDTGDIEADLLRLAEVAYRRSEGCDAPPFGLCHSEFHRTSIHIGPDGWRLLDWARAFIGPGLLDIASWQDTSQTPNPDTFDHLLAAYIAAGGPDAAASRRAGLLPAAWAYGWHRLWVIDWYLEQCTQWIADPSLDDTYQQVIRRHLTEGIELLKA